MSKDTQDNHYDHQELSDRLVTVLRTAKTVTGGRDFSFLGVVVVGDRKNQVGFGLGKAKEVPTAIAKAQEAARKNMITVDLAGHTIPHEIVGRHGASEIIMLPASQGTGVIAGGAMRAVFDVLGLENVLAKCKGSRSPINVLLATFDALSKLQGPMAVAKRRRRSVSHVLGLTLDHQKQAKAS